MKNISGTRKWQETNMVPAEEYGLDPTDGGATERHDAVVGGAWRLADSDLSSSGCLWW